MSAFVSPVIAVVVLCLLAGCVHGVRSYQVATQKGCSVAGATLVCPNN